jgi:hypothetical protein
MSERAEFARATHDDWGELGSDTAFKMTFARCLCFLIAFVGPFDLLRAQVPAAAPPLDDPQTEQRIAKLLGEMTLEEKIGQLVHFPVEPRKEPNFSYRILRGIYPAFRLLFSNQVIRADDLARAMVDVAVQGTGDHQSLVLENRDIRAIVES